MMMFKSAMIVSGLLGMTLGSMVTLTTGCSRHDDALPPAGSLTTPSTGGETMTVTTTNEGGTSSGMSTDASPPTNALPAATEVNVPEDQAKKNGANKDGESAKAKKTMKKHTATKDHSSRVWRSRNRHEATRKAAPRPQVSASAADSPSAAGAGSESGTTTSAGVGSTIAKIRATPLTNAPGRFASALTDWGVDLKINDVDAAASPR